MMNTDLSSVVKAPVQMPATTAWSTHSTPHAAAVGDHAAYVGEKVVSRCKTPLIEVIQRGFELYEALPTVARSASETERSKLPPLREYAQAQGLALSTYWRLVSTYLLYRRFPEIASYRHLGVAHLSVILGVQEECQLYFLRMAELCRWSRRTLEREVRAHHRQWQWSAKTEGNRHMSKLRAAKMMAS
jgi:hypothetical protein